ncbi:MAG: hypothetical protein KUG56_05860 [Kordiimonadaceae bacterium]|nr:hypothetical protein [Kordiimonadaceae bacterium]
MHHQLCEDFYQYWLSCKQDDALPLLSAFSPEKLAEFDNSGCIFSLQNGEIVFQFLGEKNALVFSENMVGKSMGKLHARSMQEMQLALIKPCITLKIGISRVSRVWFGHRHKEVEGLMLPVADDETGAIAIVGVTVTFVDPDARDKIYFNPPLVERIVTQNYISFGRRVDFSILNSHCWAVLDTMGAVISVDGIPLEHEKTGLAGGAGVDAVKAAHAKVLCVAPTEDFSFISSRMGERYNLHLVETELEARWFLKSDLIDILITVEKFGDTTGAELIKQAQEMSDYTACVLLLDQQAQAEDSREEKEGKLIYRLVRPVGEFALRKALDEANAYVMDKRRHKNT